jgi:RNA polymerase sigma factor (sigma-70 family)
MNGGAPLKDEELARQVQQGEHDAFGTLVERYEQKLLRYGKRFLSNPQDIEDIVQDVFTSAYQNIQSFDVTQSFSPWIYRISHNKFIDRIKKHSRTPVFSLDFDTLFAHPIHDEGAETERERREMRDMIDRALEKISVKYREILVLHYFEELSYKEIGEVLRVPTGTVGIRLKRAKEALRKIYEKLGIHYGK